MPFKFSFHSSFDFAILSYTVISHLFLFFDSYKKFYFHAAFGCCQLFLFVFSRVLLAGVKVESGMKLLLQSFA